MAKQKDPHIARHYFWAGIRIALGLIFLWAFFDKLIGLGFTTCLDAKTNVITVLCKDAWINGGSPTTGFLKFGTRGPLAEVFQAMAGSSLVDGLFMAGLLGVGLTLVLGIMLRIGSLTGVLMLSLMWLAFLPPEHHPFLDEHILYIIVLLGVAYIHPCRHFGLGNYWSKLSFVKKYSFLE